MAPRAPKPVTAAVGDIDAQIAKLQEKKKALIKKQSERVAKIVQDSGLAAIDISDDDLLVALQEVAARFQGQKPALVDTSNPKVERTDD